MWKRVRKGLFDWWKRLTDPVGRSLADRMNSAVEFDRNDVRDNAQQKAREEFLQIFAMRSWRYIVFGTGLIIGVAIVDITTCGTLQDQTYGLALDLAGAMILGRGLIKGPIAIVQESKTYYDYSPPAIRSLSKDAVDGIFGITFLIVGILLQFIAITHLYPSFPPDIVSKCLNI